jgi:hypothetical protein
MTRNFQKPTLLVLLLAACCLALSSCKKETLADKLEGEWNVKSYTGDGVEYISPSDITSFDMEYEEYDADDREGDFSWDVRYSDGSSEVISGTYEVDIDDEELELKITNSGLTFTVVLDIDLDGDDLELSGNIDGEATVFKAERD